MESTFLTNLGRRLARGEPDLAPRAGRWSTLAHCAAIALILPGGSLIALAMLSRRYPAVTPLLRSAAFVALIGVAVLVPQSG